MIRFGTAGIPHSCSGGSVRAVSCVKELSLDALELEFVHGVRMKEDKAEEIAKKAKENDVFISAHAPYYINLCTDDEQKLERSKEHIIATAKITAKANGRIIVFHPGFYLKLSKQEAFRRAKNALLDIEERLKQEGINIILGAETTGKYSAFGNLYENIKLSQELEMVQVVVDFAHLQARGFPLVNEEQYRKLFNLLEKELSLDYFHSHFSEINYTDKGERNHLNLGTKWEPDFRALAKVLKENGYSGTIISETPDIEQSALKMKEIYNNM